MKPPATAIPCSRSACTTSPVWVREFALRRNFQFVSAMLSIPRKRPEKPGAAHQCRQFRLPHEAGHIGLADVFEVIETGSHDGLAETLQAARFEVNIVVGEEDAPRAGRRGRADILDHARIG